MIDDTIGKPEGAEEQNQDFSQDTDNVETQEPVFTFKTFEDTADLNQRVNEEETDFEEEEEEQDEIVDLEALRNDPDYEFEEEFEEEEEEEEIPTPSLDIETAFNFLKKEKNIDAESIDEFIERIQNNSKETSEALPEDVAKFIEFRKETGNTSYEDFLATQKDWTQEDSEVVLKTYLKSQNPGLTDKEIDFKFRKNYSYDEDFDDEDVVMEKEINKKQDLQKAYQVLDAQKEKYKVNRGSENFIPEEYKNAYKAVEQMQQQNALNQEFTQKVRQDFLNKTEQVFSKDFEGFKVNADGKEFVVKVNNLDEVKSRQSDLVNFEKKFFDQNNNCIDPQGYHKALYAAYDPDGFAEHFINIGKAMQAEEDERISKNITMDTTQKVPQGNPMGLTVKVVK